ncbi:hypothetical protein [Fluviibacter phosphoraccumulans]|uniref:Uncharacterized protein n=1 Tax=Fluviibacter phosphoraccumulans TaxID=1751046 RepID=A0A7R6R6D5_9RHOO|nr:hypothetical protein [Fluviibacter phosphoraccumulans]BBU68779.1 hypothetical protein ICHIAU1_10620 [Fluviibacter phosphoraccumulans]BBU72068.1 hypothetical protein ICHIJ1_19870 [Fluviibacter phosphoraccumulans]
MLDDRASMEPDRERFEHLLPFFITGRLGAEDQAFAENYVASHRDAAASIQAAERMRRVVRCIGIDRDPEPTLQRISVTLQATGKFASTKSVFRRILSWLGGFLLVLAALVLITKAVYYAADKIGWLKVGVEPTGEYKNTHGSFTLKAGASMVTVALIVERYGGEIVHSSALTGVERIFVNVVDKARLPALIDELMDAGLIEAAVVLL